MTQPAERRLNADTLHRLIYDEWIRSNIGTSYYLRLVSKKTGAVVRVRLTRAIQLQGVGAGGYWLSMNFDGAAFNKFTSKWEAVGSFASAEPLRGWTMCFNSKWKDANKATKHPVREQSAGMTTALWLQQKLHSVNGIAALCQSCDIYLSC